MAKQKEAWDKLSMLEKALLIKLSIDNGISSLKLIRDTYNLYSDGGQKEVLDKVNSSNANFVQRLKDPNRKNIPDWESPTDRISTHKLSVGTDENGNHYIFPEVQEINGELIDFTRPPYHRFVGEISAEMRGDTVRVPSLEDAIKFTETYKQYYPFNSGGNLAHKYDGNSTLTQELYIKRIPGQSIDTLGVTLEPIQLGDISLGHYNLPRLKVAVSDTGEIISTGYGKRSDPDSFQSTFVLSDIASAIERYKNNPTALNKYFVIPSIHGEIYTGDSGKGRAKAYRISNYIPPTPITIDTVIPLPKPHPKPKRTITPPSKPELSSMEIKGLDGILDLNLEKDNTNVYTRDIIRPIYIGGNTPVQNNLLTFDNVDDFMSYYGLATGGNLVYKKSTGGPTDYPEVTIKEEPWVDEYFKNNTNVAGMAIGEGMNGVNGDRRVIINPYNAQMSDSTSRASVLLNERLRHVMDQENFSLPNITKELIQKYNGTSYLGDTLNIGRTEAARYLSGDPSHNLTGSLKLYIDSLKLNYKKSTGGPLYPFSFEKNPFFKTPVVRYDEGGKKLDASNPGGYTDEQLNKNYLIWKTYDPTGGLNFINYVLSLNFGNLARGEENEYWKEYLGLNSAVPFMNSNAHTEWDKQIEALKKQNGELASDFYGTTPRMDYNILALADTLMLGEMVRNYEKYDLEYNLPSIESLTEAYELAKTILNNPNKWTQVDGEIEVNNWPFNPNISESNPLGMLANFGMKWVPEENALYMHDTYDFPKRVHKRTEIPVRPREMKIRSRISFDPTKGSWLLRSPVNYNTNIPAKTTK